MKKHPIDKLFAQKLKNQRREPGETTWAKLEKKLGKTQKKKKKKPVIWWSATAAAVLLILGLSYVTLLQTSTNTPDFTAENKEIQKLTPIAPDRHSPKIIQEQTAIVSIERKTIVLPENKNTGNVLQKPEMSIALAPPIERIAAKATDDQLGVEQVAIEDITVDIIENTTMLAQQASTKPVKITIKLAGNKNGSTQNVASNSGFNFREFVAFAKVIKEGEFGLEDLRDAKQELLRFDNKKTTNP